MNAVSARKAVLPKRDAQAKWPVEDVIAKILELPPAAVAKDEWQVME